MTCGIYLILNKVTARVYIGQSVGVELRRPRHFHQLRKGIHKNTHLQHSFMKHGEENFAFLCIHECTPSELTAKEQAFLDFYKTFGTGVYNACGPVDSPTRGSRLTAEHKAKVSAGLRGRPVSDETRRKIRDAQVGRAFTEEHKQRIREAGFRRAPASEETRKKLSVLGKSIPRHNNSLAALRDSQKNCRRRVAKYDLYSGELLEEFESATAAGRSGPFHQSAISQCCLGKRAHHGGYVWRYIDV